MFEGTLGISVVMMILRVTKPAMWDIESCRAKNERLLKNQPLMHYLEDLRKSYALCLQDRVSSVNGTVGEKINARLELSSSDEITSLRTRSAMPLLRTLWATQKC